MSGTPREGLKLGVSGVRGQVGSTFTPGLAMSMAQAFGTYAGRGAVVVGRDTRPSGQMAEYAVIAGLLSVGCRPVLAGITPTPSLLCLTRALGAHGGIAITASHNPESWNALKFIGRDGRFLGVQRAADLFDTYHQQDFPLVDEIELPRVRCLEDSVRGHFAKVLEYVDAEQIRRAGFRVAVDCCNGVGALTTRGFLESLGCEVVTIHDAPTGRFERPPEPLPEHLGPLAAAVTRHDCAVGFAQDPDGDRLALVDEHGAPLGEDLTVAIAIQQVLSAHERGPVAVNLSSSRCIDDVADAHGSEVIRTATGEVHVVSAMQEHGAVVGGENSGGVIVPAIHPCRDSYAAMALVLERMAFEGRTVSALRADIPSYHLVKGKVPIRPESAPGVLREVRRRHASADQDLSDGVYIDLGGATVHVRRSNTEPVMRYTVESPTESQTQTLANDIRNLIESVAGSGRDSQRRNA